MNTPPSLDVLKEQFESQTSQLSHLNQVLAALDPHLGLEVDGATLRAFEDAIETVPVLPASTPPGLGVRA